MRRVGAGAVEIGAVALIALGVRLIQLDHAPFIDELNHVLAAQSLLEDGDLAILDGSPYTRAWIYTYLVAGFYAVLGVSLEVGRLPAVFAGVALICLFFTWLRAMAGALAGWVTALLLCFAPISIYLSQWVRFYTLHALAFWLGVLGVYLWSSGDRRLRVVIGSVAAFALAFHLQDTTLVGIGGVLAWLALVHGPGAARRWWRSPRRGWIALGVALSIAAVLAAAVASGFVENALAKFRIVDYWAASHADNVRFYHWLLEDQYGFLWSLWPLMLLLSLARAPRGASLFGAIFVVALVAHSLAAWKAERYLFYALPGFLAVWGIASSALIPWVGTRVEDGLRRMVPWIPRPAARWGAAAALVAAAAFAVTGLQLFDISRTMLTREESEWTAPAGHVGERYRGEPDWRTAREHLGPLADSVATVVSSNELKSAYYLDRLDYVLYAGRLVGWNGEQADEFSALHKVGRPVISSSASVDLLVTCTPSGLIVLEEHVVGWSMGVPDSTAAYIAERTREVPLPDAAGIRAHTWTSPASGADARCDRLPSTTSASPGR